MSERSAVTPQGLHQWMASDAAVWKSLPSGSEADAAMDSRDQAETERKWLREHESVQRLLSSVTTSDMERKLVKEIAEAAFRKAFEASHHPELAGLVSDDLQLLAGALVVGYRSPTLEKLWQAYSEGRFPLSVS
jgi:hypothetical protein